MADGARQLPRVVILGGGFAGLTAAKALRRAPVEITLLDRRNHHVFQPLLYQVATAALSPANIAMPIRKALRTQRNVTVLLGEAKEIDVARRTVRFDGRSIAYDYLIVAAGVRHSYFGNEAWSKFAPGLKTLEDALDIRRRFLMAFERAELEQDVAKRRAALNFVVVGGGPTGVELAGAMAEICRKAITRDFRRIDTTSARVILVEAEDRLLGSFPEECSARAAEQLRALGVEVRVGSRVTEIDKDGVTIGEDRIATRNVFWAAGVEASSIGASLGAALDRAGRVRVERDLSIAGHPEVFVVGDLAAVTDEKSGKHVPGVAPAAMQMGRFVARLIAREARGKAGVSARAPFAYVDKGLLATIGRNRAVAAIWGQRLSGVVAWLLWAVVHVFFLINFRNKLIVLFDWAWMYVFFDRGARLITGEGDGEDSTGALDG